MASIKANWSVEEYPQSNFAPVTRLSDLLGSVTMPSRQIVFTMPTAEEQLASLGLAAEEIDAALPLLESGYGPVDHLTPGTYNISLPGVEPVAPQPTIVNQDVIAAIYAVAREQGQDGWLMLRRAGLAHLVRQRQDLYDGLPFEQLTGLTPTERRKIGESLLGEPDDETVSPPLVVWSGPTDNYSRGRAGHSIDLIVLHSIAAKRLTSALAWFKNPQAGASTHYVLADSGEIRCLVREQATAWHAGLARRRDLTDEQNRLRVTRDDKIRANRRGIGIELVSPGPPQRTQTGTVTRFGTQAVPSEAGATRVEGQVGKAYTDAQYEALITLVAYLCLRYNVPAVYPPHGPGRYEDSYVTLAEFRGILAHAAIDELEADPGPNFDWDRLMHGLQTILQH
jgi:N-acetyl-anhydromuramyl-L-alanine amidase AmpD